MKATLKDFYSPDIDVKLSDYIPDCSDNFGFLGTLIVGEEKLGGRESFDVFICTPLWLIANHNKNDIIIGRHYLIVFEYNYERIFSRLRSEVEDIECSAWDDIGLMIGRIGKWEFEDYRE